MRADGVEFLLWAPRLPTVTLLLDGKKKILTPIEDGYHHTFVAGARAGQRYAFDLGDARGRPDPATWLQPEGVHGPSEIVDPRAFSIREGPGRAVRDEIIYELHVGTFTGRGDLIGASERLGELADLGITAIELMPLSSFPGRRNWGYDGVAPGSVQASYGGPQALAAFVDVAHALGISVVIDLVLNHLGPEGNYVSEFGPYFTRDVQTPWGDALDYGNVAVRRWAIDHADRFFRSYRVDAIRLDAVHAITDRSPRHLVAELAERGRIIAESDLNDPLVVLPRTESGWGCDAQWSDDFHHALHALLTGERQGYYADFGRLEDLATAMSRGFVYVGQQSVFRGSPHGKNPASVPPHRFLVFAQNHDQVGNRAKGDRLSTLLPLEAQKAVAATVLLSGNTPMLFMGEEWGATTPFLYFTDHGDPVLACAVTEGRRREFEKFAWGDGVPDPQSPETFEKSKVLHEEKWREPHATLLEWHRTLLKLRRSAIPHGLNSPPEVITIEGTRALAWRLGDLLVLVSYQPEGARVRIPFAPTELVDLPGYGVRIWRYSGPARSVSSTIDSIPLR